MKEPIGGGVRHFAFPLHSIPAKLVNSRWAEVTVGLTMEDVGKVLAGVWPVPADAMLARLREKFLSYRPAGITAHASGSYLQLDHPAVDGGAGEVGDSYFVEFPSRLEDVEAAMKESLGAREADGFLTPALVEFYAVFPCLREDFETAGHFIQPGEWRSLGDDLAAWPHLVPQGFWADAVCVYHARNGDMMVLAPSGEVAWWCCSEAEIQPIAKDFSGLVEYLTGYLDERWPLDSCGP